MKKIAFVIYSLGSGGAERVCTAIASGLKKRGFDITVITLSCHIPDFYSLENIPRIALALDTPSYGLVGAFRANIKRIQTLRNTLTTLNPDIVISFVSETNILIILATIGTPIRVIATEHNQANLLKSRLWRFLRPIAYRFVHTLVSVSSSVDNEYSYLPAQKRYVIGNPLPDNLYALANEDPLFPLPPRFIVAVGRCDEAKGHHFIIDAFEQVTSIDETLMLIIIGQGPDIELLKNKVKEKKLSSRVFFLGRLFNPFCVMKRALALVSGTQSEGFGNIFIEAMALGIPVIAFDCAPATRELLHDDVGILVPCRNITAFATAIQNILTQEETLYIKSLRQKKALQFEGETIINEWEVLLNNKVLPNFISCYDF